jgi:hypothetical protein
MLRTMRPAGRGTESAIAIFEQPSHIDGNPRVGNRAFAKTQNGLEYARALLLR